MHDTFRMSFARKYYVYALRLHPKLFLETYFAKTNSIARSSCATMKRLHCRYFMDSEHGSHPHCVLAMVVVV